MASEQRQCPRCKTWNARARTNCSQCGAVMLGVAALDIEALARGEGEPLGVANSAPEDNPELRQVMDAIARQRAERPATDAVRAGSGCAGCLGKLILLVAIVVGGATIVAMDAPDSELGVQARKLWHELEKEFKRGKRRKVTAPPYVPPPPPTPRPAAVPPDPWKLPVQPAPPAPSAASAPLLAPTDTDEPPLTERGKAIAKALDRRAPLFLRCVQTEPKPGEARKVTTQVALRVHADKGGVLELQSVVEPEDPPAGVMRCLRFAARGLAIPNGDPVTFVYRWPNARP